MIKGDKINIYEKSFPKITENIKKVSVIIPNYNYANFLTERIDSVLFQTYPIYELIILDDASTDNSDSIIKDKITQIKDIKVKYIRNSKNGGNVFSQWQKGIAEVTGDYFWIAEADDSADPHFLENVMVGFNDAKVVLSYSDSMRINENNIVIAENCQDLYNMFNSTRWDQNYIHNGDREIRDVLSVTNTILNVSSVVWKNGNYSDILEAAKKYKVAGDWYIYYQLLKNNKIAFCKMPLNYYRKHGSSVCTDIKADIEYQEICMIEEMAAKDFYLPMSTYKLQRLRRSYMEQNVSKDVHKKKIAWVIPHPGFGSGGHRTIIQNVNALIRHGYECDIYVEEDWVSTSDDVASKIDSYYEPCAANVYVGISLRSDYDLLFATGWTTIDMVKPLNVENKAYFIQDYEPWFFPMGDNYIKTENSYYLNYHKITIGKWLAHKMNEEFNSNAQFFDFCADLNIYKPIKDCQKENAICYIWQPEKPRRCDALAMQALFLVKTINPNIKIYLYGSNNKQIPGFDSEKLGIISPKKCNELYNKCMVGLCMSASNPSRIPFEMMAAGLPVVELYKENNLYDLPNDCALLAMPNPEAIATAILKLFADKNMRDKMSINGVKYMQNYPLEKGFKQFTFAVDNIIYNKPILKDKISKSYTKKAIVSTKKIAELALINTKFNNCIDERPVYRKKITKVKNFGKRALKSLGYRIINIANK
jgi:O-antigen biosynthesis protein